MFDFIHSNRQFVTVALGLVTLGLVGGGLMTTIGTGGGASPSDLARVDGTAITPMDLAREVGDREIPDQYKSEILKRLVQKKVLLSEADKRNIQVGNQTIRDRVLEIKDFKNKDGQFDADLYKQLLSLQHMTPEAFEKTLRDEQRTQYLVNSVFNSAFSSKTAYDHQIDLLGATRQATAAVIPVDQYVAQIKLTDADIKQYYDNHHGDFQQSKRVKVDYVVLSRDQFAQSLPVSDSDALAYFNANKPQAKEKPEERRVSHILVKVDKDATAAQRAAAKQKAESLLAQVKKSPGQFAELAKANSDDPGSAAKGGDLDFFRAGAMVKPFSDVAFSLPKGQISGVVETEFGYHILMTTDIHPASKSEPTFEESKPTIVAKLQHDNALKAFQAMADQFGETVDNQRDSLKATADALKLPILHSDWITSEGATEPALKDPKVLEAAFSAEVVNKHHNSEAIETTPGTWVALHSVEFQPDRTKSLDEVKPQIVTALTLEKASKLAAAEGEKALTALKKGEAPALTWQAPKLASYLNPNGLSKPALTLVLNLPANKLPAYDGYIDNHNFVIYKVEAANSTVDAVVHEAQVKQLSQIGEGEQVYSYLGAVTKDHKVVTPSVPQ